MPFSILDDSTVDIATACLKKANRGFIVSDAFEGSASCLFNVEKGETAVRPCTVESLYHEGSYDNDLSSSPFRYVGRVGAKTRISETASMFEPGSAAEAPNSLFSEPLTAAAKLISLSRSNGEEAQPVRDLMERQFGKEISDRLESYTPITDVSRTKPWALEDAPRARHLNGHDNAGQMVRIGLGNYVAGLGTKGRLIDWDKVAITLRALGVLVMGEELWARDYLRRAPATLKYHLNLSEFPMATRPIFLPLWLTEAFKTMPCVSEQVRDYMLAAMDQTRQELSNRGLLQWRVPLRSHDKDLVVAASELDSELGAKALFGPLFAPLDDITDVIQRPISFAPRAARGTVARVRDVFDVMRRVWIPMLTWATSRDHWPHEARSHAQMDEWEEFAEVIERCAPAKALRLVFQLLERTSVNRVTAWKTYLRYFYMRGDPVPSFPTQDAYGVFLASLKQIPERFGRRYLAYYNAAMAYAVRVKPRDLIHPGEWEEVVAVSNIRARVFDRISAHFTTKYAAEAKLIVRRLRDKRKIDPNRKKRYKDRLVTLQFRISLYPAFRPIGPTGFVYDRGRVNDALRSKVRRYYDKRRKKLAEMPTTLETALVENTETALAQVDLRYGSKFKRYYDDVVYRVTETLNDVDRVLTYELTDREEEEGIQVDVEEVEDADARYDDPDFLEHDSGSDEEPYIAEPAPAPSQLTEFEAMLGFDLGMLPNTSEKIGSDFDRVDLRLEFPDNGFTLEHLRELLHERGLEEEYVVDSSVANSLLERAKQTREHKLRELPELRPETLNEEDIL